MVWNAQRYPLQLKAFSFKVSQKFGLKWTDYFSIYQEFQIRSAKLAVAVVWWGNWNYECDKKDRRVKDVFLS